MDTLKAIHAATVHTDGWVNKEARKKWEHFSYRTLKRVYDAKVIRAEFLIHHIDQAFEVWEKRPWNKYLPFDDFCELILPYRVGDEPLEEWRSWYKERYESILDSLYQGTDVVEATDCLGTYLRQEKDFRYSVELELPHLGAGFCWPIGLEVVRLLVILRFMSYVLWVFPPLQTFIIMVLGKGPDMFGMY